MRLRPKLHVSDTFFRLESERSTQRAWQENLNEYTDTN
jgi:hypothetical protein